MADNSFIYDANEVMRIIGKQPSCSLIGSEFFEAYNAHKAAGSNDNDLFSIAIDFYLLGICCGKRLERAEKQHKEYRPITEKAH